MNNRTVVWQNSDKHNMVSYMIHADVFGLAGQALKNNCVACNCTAMNRGAVTTASSVLSLVKKKKKKTTTVFKPAAVLVLRRSAAFSARKEKNNGGRLIVTKARVRSTD